MALTMLQASDMCGAVGGQLSSTTIAVNPEEISVVPPLVIRTSTYTSVYTNYFSEGFDFTSSYVMTGDFVTSITSRPPVTRLPSNFWASCTESVSLMDTVISNPGLYSEIPCHPVLKIPNTIWKMQLEWMEKDCQNVIAG
jgi:hypothetical protein